MLSHFSVDRYFHTNVGWYICMRPGDEELLSYCGHQPVQYNNIEGKPIAGPFRTKRIMLRWLDGFISSHANPRGTCKKYIPDELIIPGNKAVF